MNKNTERKPMIIRLDPTTNQWSTVMDNLSQSTILQIQRMPAISQVTLLDHNQYLIKFFRAFTTNKEEVRNAALLFVSTIYDVPMNICVIQELDQNTYRVFVGENFR